MFNNFYKNIKDKLNDFRDKIENQINEGRLLVIGDIHGNILGLLDILDQINFNPQTDTLVFLGDYIDGNQKEVPNLNSKRVVKLVLDLKRKNPESVVLLKGNHEVMAKDYILNEDNSLYLKNRGLETLESYDDKEEFERDILRLNELPLIYEEEFVVFVHAGLRPTIKIANQSKRDMLWIREDFINSDYEWEKIVIAGHTTVDRIEKHGNKVLMDTGSGKHTGGFISCLDITNNYLYTSK